ncbi:adenine deaminase [Rhodocyclaceae bacterium]
MSKSSGVLQCNHVDIAGRRIRATRVTWEDGVLRHIVDCGAENPDWPYLLPGFIDAHVHIESSLLPPAEFARQAVRHGTIATASDPHEIANVLGIDGVRWMLANAAETPFHFLFGAPSCVPATTFETAGGRLGLAEVSELLATPGIGYLSEVMNFPAVLDGDPAVLAMIAAARQRGLPVDGHAPGLCGVAAAAYAAAGISTDHECTTLVEAEEKLAAGMYIQIREGSAARNFNALQPLFSRHPGRVMLCTDDCHPDDLARGHIDRLVARAVALGHDVFTVLEAACLTPQRHYGLALGQLCIGDPFNAVQVDNLRDFSVANVWLRGQLVASQGQTLLPASPAAVVNRFAARPVRPDELNLVIERQHADDLTWVIEAADGQLLTKALELPVSGPQPTDDILLLAVVNRYQPAAPAVALIRGFGLQGGAIASSVAHDSHNVIGVGCDAVSLATALNAVIEQQGGLAVVDSAGQRKVLPLPIAGLMSDADGEQVAAQYAALNTAAREQLGSPLRAPFMTLSFMALLVIPELKLSDRGLFDGRRFVLTDLACHAAC